MQTPAAGYFKPRGIPLAALQEVVLSVDELEAVRLADYLDLRQQDAAQQLKISQPTLHRVLQSAHRKVADALVNGKALRIRGGMYKMPNERWFECFTCRHQWREPFGTGRPSQCPRCHGVVLQRLAQEPIQSAKKVNE
jgi:predicted DNA-binding protein (UPF0251 family)